MRETIPPLAHTSSWRGSQLSPGILLLCLKYCLLVNNCYLFMSNKCGTECKLK